jgi:hypothetical protein
VWIVCPISSFVLLKSGSSAYVVNWADMENLPTSQSEPKTHVHAQQADLSVSQCHAK